MIEHAMKYVQMSQRVREELPPLEVEEDSAAVVLEAAELRLQRAESELVKAYGDFRFGLRLAVLEGSARAAEYLERTTWDLT